MNQAVEIPPRREAADLLDDFCQTIDLLILADERVKRSLQAEQIRLFQAVIAACRHGVPIQTISRTLIHGVGGHESGGSEPFEDAMEALYQRLCCEAYQTDFKSIAASARVARAREVGPKRKASDNLLHNVFAAATGAECPEIYGQLLELVLHMRLVPCFDIHPGILANTAETFEDAVRGQAEGSPESGIDLRKATYGGESLQEAREWFSQMAREQNDRCERSSQMARERNDRRVRSSQMARVLQRPPAQLCERQQPVHQKSVVNRRRSKAEPSRHSTAVRRAAS